MARTRRLDDMRSDIRRAADIGNATVRHPNANLTRIINESIQRLREKVSDNGHTYYLKSVTGTVAAGASSIDLSGVADFLRAYALDIQVDGAFMPAEEFDLRERNLFGGLGATDPDTGIPLFWMLRASTIELMPKADAAYPYKLWYLPTWTDLTADSDTFDGVAGWEDWVKWDGCVEIAVRDKNTLLYELASAERSSREQLITKTAPKRTRLRVGKRKDTRAARAAAYARARNGAPP